MPRSLKQQSPNRCGLWSFELCIGLEPGFTPERLIEGRLYNSITLDARVGTRYVSRPASVTSQLGFFRVLTLNYFRNVALLLSLLVIIALTQACPHARQLVKERQNWTCSILRGFGEHYGSRTHHLIICLLESTTRALLAVTMAVCITVRLKKIVSSIHTID